MQKLIEIVKFSSYFIKMLSMVGTPYFIDIANKTFKEQLIKDFLTKQGIAISDTVYQAKRLANNALDKFLEVATEQDIRALLDKLPNCHTLITTGEKASQVLCQRYDVPVSTVGKSVKMTIGDKMVQLYRLPSSSRAYPLSLDKKACHYQVVFDKIFGHELPMIFVSMNLDFIPTNIIDNILHN